MKRSKKLSSKKPVLAASPSPAGQSTVTQKVTLPADPKALFDCYMDPKKHAAITGAPVKISKTGEFSAFDGMLAGKILHTVPGSMIVQTWRSSSWKKGDKDSILCIRFQPGKETTVELTHIGVPEYDFAGVTKGWDQYYFQPWKKWLKQNSSKQGLKPAMFKALPMTGRKGGKKETVKKAPASRPSSRR